MPVDAGVLLDETDEALAQRAAQGCADSFAELDRRMRPRLLAALYRRVRDRHACEDLVQQTLWQAYQALPRYDISRRFAPWLFTIAFNLATDRKRKIDRRPTITSNITDHTNHAPHATPTDEADSPIARLVQREQHDNLWHTADITLSDHAYTVMWLRYGENLDMPDIAKMLSKTQVSIRVTHHRALAKLRTALNKTPHATSSQTPTPDTTTGEKNHA